MPHKFDARHKELLLTDERHEILQPAQLLRDLGLRSGHTLADIGSGPGFFTIPAAEIVGKKGVVLAADVQGEMLTAVRSRATAEGLTQVRVVKTSESDVPIPPGTCDVVLLAFTLNEIEHRASFLHKLARLLKREGRLVVIEWEKHPTEVGPPLEDRISPEETLADATAAGLGRFEHRAVTDDIYLSVFRLASAG